MRKLRDVSHAMSNLQREDKECQSLGDKVTMGCVGPKVHEFHQNLANKVILEGSLLSNLLKGLWVRKRS